MQYGYKHLSKKPRRFKETRFLFTKSFFALSFTLSYPKGITKRVNQFKFIFS